MSHSTKLNSVIDNFNSNTVVGLTTLEANARLAKYGENVLVGKKKKTNLQRFFEQFKDTMVIILLFAAGLSLAIAIYNQSTGSLSKGDLLEEFLEVIIILLIVILNAVLGTVQESKAEKSLEALQKMSAPKVRVIRDGILATIESAKIVVGDIIVLEAGDISPSDARLIESASLKVDESALTGESMPVEKDYTSICAPNSPIGDRTNMVFSGCPVTYGRAKAIVTATGMKTEIGKIATLLNNDIDTKTPLQQKLTVLSKYLGIICLAVSAVVFAIGIIEGLILKQPGDPILPIFMKYFMTAVSLAVAAIPEGLPAIVTIVLARGVQRMAARNAIARKLPAVETLGSASVICSDKTGTLTQNRMTVVSCYTGSIEQIDKASPKTIEMLKLATLCCDATVTVDEFGVEKHLGDPTESCIVVASRKYGFDKAVLQKQYERVYEIPFDSDRKLMTTVNKYGDKYIVIVKGAWESILEVSTDASNEKIKRAVVNMSEQALRVLAVATKTLESLPDKFDNKSLESGLSIVGLIGMIDPPRAEAKSAVTICKSAGIKPVMITGDHIITASAIAKQLGIMGERDKAITGAELEKMSDEQLSENINSYAVYARVSPTDKIRIVKAWQNKGAVVAMTGDGVNDAPALKAADIGCAMGITGTDVAKGAADMVLTDDNFATIVEAVEQGRGIFDNIKKAVKYLLGCNFGEVMIVFLAMLIWRETPLFAIQLLWINLVTDGLPALALGMEQPEGDVMQRKPKLKTEGFFAHGMGLEILLFGSLFTVATLIAYNLGRNMEGVSAEQALICGSTMAFLVLSTCQLFFALEVRSARSIFVDSPFKNKFMILASLISFALVALVAFIPPIANVFSLTQLPGEYYGYALILALLPCVGMEAGYLLKFLVKKYKKNA